MVYRLTHRSNSASSNPFRASLIPARRARGCDRWVPYGESSGYTSVTLLTGEVELAQRVTG